jgi:short-subunit dehydrogenase
MLAVNIAALTHLTYLLLPSLLPAHRAAILNVSSVAGFFPLPHTAIYCATKAYVTSFSEALAMELAPKGIRVTALCPGPVPTEFSQVAARSTEIRPHHADLMPMFVASPGQVVKTGLRAVAEGKACVIPNLLLAFAVRTALLIPFDFTRKVISYFRMSL